MINHALMVLSSITDLSREQASAFGSLADFSKSVEQFHEATAQPYFDAADDLVEQEESHLLSQGHWNFAEIEQEIIDAVSRQSGPSYEKEDMQRMWWVATLAQLTPAAYFYQLQSVDKEAYCASNDCSAMTWQSMDHWSFKTRQWAYMTAITAVVYAPLTVFGAFAMSEILPQVAGFVLRHWVSNLMFPAAMAELYIYSGVVLEYLEQQKEAAEFERSPEVWFAYIFVSIGAATYYGTMYQGIYAHYWATGNARSEDDAALFPSIIYLLNWRDHVTF